ncbi:MAG TPA: hypothetical protein VKT28_05610 [Puia sp.]|nr:hypothetical protein [Puia sp.]
MALQTATYLKGKLDNIIFYQSGGTYIARSMPVLVRQSAATKQRSINFGIASAAGRQLRQQLANSIAFPKDKRMQSRFSGAIAQWLKLSDVSTLPPLTNLPFLNHFSFNESTSVAERFKVSITVSQPWANVLQVHIPAFIPTVSFSAPAHTDLVDCILTVASCKLVNSPDISGFSLSLHIPYTDELINEQVLSFPVNTGHGSLVVSAALLKYRLGNGNIDLRPAFMPSSVIDARYC